MTDLFLIAHKVRGEPAFDVAVQIDCPLCYDGDDSVGCYECEGVGFWWIIPTSGHRAYPYWNCLIEPMINHMDGPGTYRATIMVPPMPPNLPDHYPTRATPDKPKLNISALMQPVPIRRRV